jgi:hypothetical protein
MPGQRMDSEYLYYSINYGALHGHAFPFPLLTLSWSLKGAIL